MAGADDPNWAPSEVPCPVRIVDSRSGIDALDDALRDRNAMVVADGVDSDGGTYCVVQVDGVDHLVYLDQVTLAPTQP